MAIFISFNSFNIGYFVQPCNIPCSMQHVVSTPSPKPVFLMTVQEAHKEYNSLTDQIRAKYKLLDSGECGSVGTPAFNAECSKLAHLMARMSELSKHLNLPMPKELHRPLHFKH